VVSITGVTTGWGSLARAAPPKPTPKTGKLSVNAKPTCQVYVDGKSIGVTPVVGHRLRPGSYRVELRTSQGRSRYRKVTIHAGRSQKVLVRFGAAKRGSPGTLEVTAKPWAQVFVDGHAVGTTPLTGYRISDGSHWVKLKTTDGREYKRIVFVEAGRTARVFHRFSSPARRAAPEAGWLEVDSHPPSAVFVGGKKIGKTPVKDYDLPVGLHRVRLVTKDQRTHRRQVRVARDKTTRLRYRFPPRRRAARRPRTGNLRVVANHEARVYVDGKAVGWTPLIDHPLPTGLHVIRVRRGKRTRRYRLRIRPGHTRLIKVRFRR
jgi:hypothetical protein